MLKKILKLISRYPIFYMLIFLPCFLIIAPTSATSTSQSQDHQKTLVALQEDKFDIYSQNNILFYEPCLPGAVNSSSCYKINNNTQASDFWYPEGCLDNGTCTGGVYASTAYTNGHNSFLLNDTKTDENFGGMQYIYAENYDIKFDGIDGWITKFTKKPGANSTRKYYWVVLPDKAYSHGFGETYVATFENLNEPVYFIVYDTHQCAHQSEKYCEKAEQDPNKVAIGKEFFGALTKNAGNSDEAVKKAGKLTSLCRIKGKGEVTAHEDASNTNTTTKEVSDSSSTNSSNNSSSSSSTTSTASTGKYPQYFQCDSKYSGTYGEMSVCRSACGAVSMAMLVTFTTGQADPTKDIISMTNATPYWDTTGPGMTELDKKVCEKYGCEVKNINYSSKQDAIEKMKKYLNQGYSIHLSGGGSGRPYTSGGHYVGIFDIDGDDVMVANSSSKPINNGNVKMKLKDVVNNGLHGGAFSIIKGNGMHRNDSGKECDSGGGGSETGNGDVLKAVEEIIELANKNGSKYPRGENGGSTGGMRTKEAFDAVLNGAPSILDCSGFASFVIYKAFGKMAVFTSESIVSNPKYKEVSGNDVQPGDIAVYHPGEKKTGSYRGGHAAVVIEVKNGKVTKVAETNDKGDGKKNTNIGYTDDRSTGTLETINMVKHFYRWKGD